MGSIVIAGVGWTSGQLTMEIGELLTRGARVILHTARCGCADWLRARGIAFESLDSLYESCEDFDAHNRAAADAVLEAARSADVVYGVLDVRDRSAQLLAGEAAPDVRVVAGPPAEGALLALARGELRCVEASDWEACGFTAREDCLVRELDSRELAAEVKLRLMEVYPEQEAIWLLQGDAAPVRMPLYELDRADRYDHRTCALIPAQRSITELERYDFEHLNEIMRLLCGPGGCPWDRAQTHETLRTNLLEEAYEVIDAIDEGDPSHLYDELGDMLLQVAIHAEIARRHGEFDISDVTTAICGKMIHRHSHIFGSDSAADPEQVLRLWSRNKMAERRQDTCTEALRSITRTLPALLRAVKVLKRCADVGLGDDDPAAPARRCAARLDGAKGAEDMQALVGEALFDLAGFSRLTGVDPELALNAAVNRFIGRFEAVERAVRDRGTDFQRFDAETLRKYWDSVKL